MGFYDELGKEVSLNVVLKIGDEYFSTNQVDVGLVIDDENVIVKTPRINGVNFDIRRITTPIGTFSFVLSEYEYDQTSSKIMRDDAQFLNKDVTVLVGHLTGSFHFDDYIEVQRSTITTVTKIANGYSIKCKELTNLINQPAYNIEDSLQTHLLTNSTTLDVVDGDLFEDSGLIYIGSEFIAYTSKSGNTLQNLQRAQKGSPASEHDVGSAVYVVTELNLFNPIDVILTLLLSENGDQTNSIYDTLPNGLGIPQEKVDIAGLEAVRDAYFLGQKQSFLIFGYKTVLKFFESDLLQSINSRFIVELGKILVSVLDQVDLEEETPIIDENSIIGTPTWTLDSSKIVNAIECEYDYNYASKKYESLATFNDNDSILAYGEQKPLKLKFKGIYTAQNGAVIVAQACGRLLQRLSTARGKVTLNAHFDASEYPTGTDVQLIHRYLPQQGGTLGFSDQLEVMSKDVDLGKATVKYTLEFTSYTGIRIPFIAPSPTITGVVSQKKVQVSDASCLEAGYKMRIFDEDYLLDAVNTIESIDGDIVTFESEFVTTLEVGFWVKFADYESANEKQKARYAFIGSNTGFFSDGSKSYQIIY